jgi:hypothetical protein
MKLLTLLVFKCLFSSTLEINASTDVLNGKERRTLFHYVALRDDATEIVVTLRNSE